MKPDLLAERIGERRMAAKQRAKHLRAIASELALDLRKLGASRVVLFGSLASGAEPHAETDIDLCVEGLSESAVERFALEASARAGSIDLVRWESASPELRALVEAYGVDLEPA